MYNRSQLCEVMKIIILVVHIVHDRGMQLKSRNNARGDYLIHIIYDKPATTVCPRNLGVFSSTPLKWV